MLPVLPSVDSFHTATVVRLAESPVSATQNAVPSALTARSRGSWAPPFGLPLYVIGLPLRWQVLFSRYTFEVVPALARLITA